MTFIYKFGLILKRNTCEIDGCGTTCEAYQHAKKTLFRALCHLKQDCSLDELDQDEFLDVLCTLVRTTQNFLIRHEKLQYAITDIVAVVAFNEARSLSFSTAYGSLLFEAALLLVDIPTLDMYDKIVTIAASTKYLFSDLNTVDLSLQTAERLEQFFELIRHLDYENVHNEFILFALNSITKFICARFDKLSRFENEIHFDNLFIFIKLIHILIRCEVLSISMLEYIMDMLRHNIEIREEGYFHDRLVSGHYLCIEFLTLFLIHGHPSNRRVGLNMLLANGLQDSLNIFYYNQLQHGMTNELIQTQSLLSMLSEITLH